MLRYKPNQDLASMSQVSPFIALNKRHSKQPCSQKQNKSSIIKKGKALNTHTQSLHQNYSKKQINRPKAHIKRGNIKSDCQSHEHDLSTNPIGTSKQEDQWQQQDKQVHVTAATSQCQNRSIINQLYSASTSKNNSPMQNRKEEQVDCFGKLKRFDYLSGTIRNNYHPEYRPHYKFDQQVSQHTKNWQISLQKENHFSSKRDSDQMTHLGPAKKAFEQINEKNNMSHGHYASLCEFQDTYHTQFEGKDHQLSKHKKIPEKVPSTMRYESLGHPKLGKSKEKEIYEKLNLLGERCVNMLHSVSQKQPFLLEGQIGKEKNGTEARKNCIQENNWAFEQKQKVKKQESNYKYEKPNFCSYQVQQPTTAANRLHSLYKSDEKPTFSPFSMHPPRKCSQSQHQQNCQIQSKTNVSRLSHLNSKLENYIQMNLKKF